MNLAKMESLIRERTCNVLDELPRNEEFNWVDRVSIELTSRMLATLFDYPLDGRRELIRWSEVAICDINAPDALVRSEEERFAELLKFTERMNVLWEDRAKRPPEFDIISILAHSDLTNKMSLRERMGILILFLVGGNDTTRNSMSGGVWGLSQFPEQYQKLRQNPELVPSLVPEIIRWHTPVLHLRRTALADFELSGKTIKKGDKVAMWFVSGNRDDDAIVDPHDLIVDRPRAREHISFGFGVHRCVGNRLAELQLRVLWEEILKRELEIEVVDRPKYLRSNLIHGVRELPVQIH
jgi:cytochrome P450